MRVQGALIWNISPLMSSPQPPIMYTTSLWSKPFEPWAPVRLLQAQERAFLRDLRSAIEKRIDNKIASARRFAVSTKMSLLKKIQNIFHFSINRKQFSLKIEIVRNPRVLNLASMVFLLVEYVKVFIEKIFTRRL